MTQLKANLTNMHNMSILNHCIYKLSIALIIQFNYNKEIISLK